MRLIRYTSPAIRSFQPAFTRSPQSGLETEVERLFGAAQGETPGTAVGYIHLDLREDANATYVSAELPGVNRADISVELAEGTLQITAKRTFKEGAREETREFRRGITVPDHLVQADKIAASYENGLLIVTLPKREESKPRKINVLGP